MSKNIAFRIDASPSIGYGHIMRCLTLANALSQKGFSCSFLARHLHGNIKEFIHSYDHKTYILSGSNLKYSSSAHLKNTQPKGINNLVCRWEDDLAEVKVILDKIRPEWLIVDHYALDYFWEIGLKGLYGRLLVIDDLANRSHSCDVLLDQSYGRYVSDYIEYVPKNCVVLAGSKYALLRPEFSNLRDFSLNRRVKTKLKKILVSMGGVDNDNFTSRVIKSLAQTNLSSDISVDIVLDKNAPWFHEVRELLRNSNFSSRLLSEVTNMAELMSRADLAIGAAGTTSWERCCLGLPTLLVVVADNQSYIADSLIKAGAVYEIDNMAIIESINKALHAILKDRNLLLKMSEASKKVTDGRGVERVLNNMFGEQ